MRKKKRKWSLKSRLVGPMRRTWLYSPMRQDAINQAKVRTRYRCASCRKTYGRKEITVDHIEPAVGTKEGWQGWDVYIERLFCAVDKLQILCYNCHKRKTANERTKRLKAKAGKAREQVDENTGSQ